MPTTAVSSPINSIDFKGLVPSLNQPSTYSTQAFKVNKEDHLIPILCDAVKKAMTGGPDDDKKKDDNKDEDAWRDGQEPELIQLLCEELGCGAAEILDFELSLFDTQGAALSGVRDEFLVGA